MSSCVRREIFYRYANNNIARREGVINDRGV